MAFMDLNLMIGVFVPLLLLLTRRLPGFSTAGLAYLATVSLTALVLRMTGTLFLPPEGLAPIRDIIRWVREFVQEIRRAEDDENVDGLADHGQGGAKTPEQFSNDLRH